MVEIDQDSHFMKKSGQYSIPDIIYGIWLPIPIAESQTRAILDTSTYMGIVISPQVKGI